MSLGAQQRELLALIKSRATTPTDDAYIRTVAGSPRLAMVREIALWWRQHGVERGCPLTAEILRQRGLVEAAVSGMFSDGEGSPYMGLVVRDFLDRASRHPDPLVASVAQFELALLRVTQDGHNDDIVVGWDRDPYLALHRLLARIPVDVEPIGGPAQMVVARRLPRLFEVQAAAG